MSYRFLQLILQILLFHKEACYYTFEREKPFNLISRIIESQFFSFLKTGTNLVQWEQTYPMRYQLASFKKDLKAKANIQNSWTQHDNSNNNILDNIHTKGLNIKEPRKVVQCSTKSKRTRYPRIEKQFKSMYGTYGTSYNKPLLTGSILLQFSSFRNRENKVTIVMLDKCLQSL